MRLYVFFKINQLLMNQEYAQRFLQNQKINNNNINLSVLPMIRVNRQSLARQQQKKYRLRQFKVSKIRQELVSINYNMDENTCIFRINQCINVRDNFIAIELYIRPLVGIFQDIEFRPQIFYRLEYKSRECFGAPKIYNDKRIFHPNINILNCQIIVPEIITDWSPVNSYLYVFRRLKFILIEPNPHLIPNNKYNRKAAFIYKMRRQNYRNQIFSNSPLHLDQMIEYQNASQVPQQWGMIDEDQEHQIDKQNEEQKYFDIDSLFKPKIPQFNYYSDHDHKSQNLDYPGVGINWDLNEDDEQVFQVLNKQIKRINLHQVQIQQKNQSSSETMRDN